MKLFSSRLLERWTWELRGGAGPAVAISPGGQCVVGGTDVGGDGVAVPGEEVDALGYPVSLLGEDLHEVWLDVLGNDASRGIQAGKDQRDDSGWDTAVDQASGLHGTVGQLRRVVAVAIVETGGSDESLLLVVALRPRVVFEKFAGSPIRLGRSLRSFSWPG